MLSCLCSRVLPALLLVLASIPGCTEPKAQWKALVLPSIPALASVDGKDDPSRLFTLRLSNGTGARRVLFSDDDEPVQLPASSTARMRFRAETEFRGVGILAAAWGGRDAKAALRLMQSGRRIAESTFGPFVDRTWLDLETAPLPPGEYAVELAQAGADPIGWWGQRLREAGQPADEAPVLFGEPAIREAHVSPISISVGVKARRIAFLGGRSSYDHGIGWWRDYELQGDEGDRQFIGDSAGSIEVVYASGTKDTVPLVFGWNLWWSTHAGSPQWSGPFAEPFASDSEARATFERSVILRQAGKNPRYPDYWLFEPRDETIASVRILDNPAKQGFPIIAAISLETADSAGTLKPVQQPAAALNAPPVKASALAGQPWLEAAARLRAAVYGSPASNLASIPAAAPVVPDLSFQAGLTGTLLTNMWRANVADLRAKFTEDGRFHTSTPGAPNYGAYQGIGLWRNGVGFFSDQVWARDLGRTVIEMARLGDSQRVERSLRFADDRLLDLPQGFPRFNRYGERVPAHWPTVLGDPAYLDADRAGDGNQENDSHALVLLGFAATWEQRGRDPAWLAAHAATVREAGSWFVIQLENPGLWRSRDGLLYGEGEAANDGGFDVLSNTLAWRALAAAGDMLDSLGESSQAARFRSAAAVIRAAVNARLIEPAPRGTAWKSVAWNWGYGHEALAPVLSAADVGDITLASLTPAELEIAWTTYQRQLGRCPALRCVRATGFGQSYLAQAALLLDDVDTGGRLLENLASLSIDPRVKPYLIPEGIAVAPDGAFWYRTGDLGNAVQQGEFLKALSLIAGVAGWGGGPATIAPRVPASWQGLTVKDVPTPAGTVSYTLEREGRYETIRVKSTVPFTLRAGPLAEADVLVDGARAGGRTETLNGKRHLWLETLPAGEHTVAYLR